MKKLVLQEKNNNKKEKLTLNVDHAGHWGIEYLQEHQGGNNETTKLSGYLGLSGGDTQLLWSR